MDLMVWGIFGMVVSVFQFIRFYKTDELTYFWLSIFTVLVSTFLITWGWP